MNNNSINRDIYERARHKSVGQDKKVAYVKMKKNFFKGLLLATAIATVITTSGFIYGGVKLVDKVNTDSIVYEQTELGRNLVYDNTHRTDDKQGYFYDIYDIAEELVKDNKNFDKNLYGVYSAIGYNRGNKFIKMEEVVSDIGHIVKNNQDLGINYYKDFTDYCIKKGFVKEDGSIDLNAYENAIKEQIVREVEIQNLQDEVTEFKRR